MCIACRWLVVVLFMLCPMLTSAQDYMLYAGRIDNETEIDPKGWDLFKVDPLTGDRQIVFSSRNSSIRESVMDLAYEGDGMFVISLKLYNETTFEQSAKLVRVNLHTSTQTDVAGPFAGVVLRSLSMCSDGQVLCSSGPEMTINSSSIVKINLQTGVATTLYSSSVGSGEVFSGAWLAVEESPTAVIIYCPGVRSFRRIDTQSLARQNIYTLPETGLLRFPAAMSYSAGHILFAGRKIGGPGNENFCTQLNLGSLQETPVEIGDWVTAYCSLQKVTLAPDDAFFCTSANTAVAYKALSGILRKSSLSTLESYVLPGSGPAFDSALDELQGPIGLAFAPDFATTSVQDWAER